MKKTQKLNDSAEVSWLHKAKVAFAAFAFVAAGVFGISTAADVAPQADDTAQTFSLERYNEPSEGFYWSFPVPVIEDEPAEDPAPVKEPAPIKDPWDPRGGGFTSMRSGSWS